MLTPDGICRQDKVDRGAKIMSDTAIHAEDLSEQYSHRYLSQIKAILVSVFKDIEPGQREAGIFQYPLHGGFD